MKNLRSHLSILLSYSLLFTHDVRANYLLRNNRDTRKRVLEDEPVYCPTERYEPWAVKRVLHKINSLFRILDYDEFEWNYDHNLFGDLLKNEIEQYSFTSTQIKDKQREELLDMGYDEDKWDCCINHFEDYSWDEFLFYNLTEEIVALEALGWTNETYGSTNSELWPETENFYWVNLTAYQQEMASSKLCYVKETWDEELPLDEWPLDFEYPDAW